MKKITVKKAGLDINGNMTYLYNFLDGEKVVNDKFKYFGRLTKQGIKNQYSPDEMLKFMDSFGVWNNMEIGVNLGKAQKEIDRCNGKAGCPNYCQSGCYKLKRHNNLMNELRYITDFLRMEKIEEY